MDILIENYYKQHYFKKRYLNLNDFYNFIDVNYENKECLGYSTCNNPIYLVKLGKGSKKILIWSQMHGNESTGTLAMFDFLELLNYLPNNFKENLLSKFEIHFIPVLNPDGAVNWTRRNALGIDINRDYNAEHSLEMKILKQQFTSVKYDLGFNLHDQRTIYSVSGYDNPATLSFLSPSVDVERSITDIRKQSMGIMNYICNNVSTFVNNHIGRYSDEFYPNSTGDNFQKLGTPIVLFEAGHFKDDYQRHNTRKYFCYSLFFAFDFILKNDNWDLDYQKYFDIPENKENYFDVIIRNANFNINNKIIKTDLALQYLEEVNQDKTDLIFKLQVIEIGDLSKKKSWKEMNGNEINPINKILQIGDFFEI